MRIISGIVLFVALALTPLANQNARRPMNEQLSEELKLRFVDNQCMAKGGTGIINRNLYISVWSDKNKLTLGERRWTWTSKDASIPEMAIVFEDQVWPSNNLPKGFDLGHAIVISFEADKVRFFDFSKMLGGVLPPGETRVGGWRATLFLSLSLSTPLGGPCSAPPWARRYCIVGAK